MKKVILDFQIGPIKNFGTKLEKVLVLDKNLLIKLKVRIFIMYTFFGQFSKSYIVLPYVLISFVGIRCFDLP